ncbi:hypothetical protein [Zooshikella harenae]|uniref:Uncharacterized protein n=1 Tax=Zooshikella harenae TaxID=2827238 RepID=A0ABS5ZCY6_9GAMM|nr:hypothetical protein [Zooshikella harenae]MBU2711909.1 hypothetical protein [Zooshikella harenae]
MEKSQLSSIIGMQLKDIIHVGVIDFEENIGEITTFHTHLFLEVNKLFLKLESVEQYSKLKVSFNSDVDFSFDFDIEEDMSFCKYSAANIYFDSTLAENYISSVALYEPLFYDKSLACDAMEVVLDNNQCVFFDPKNLFGIKVGDSKLKDVFLMHNNINSIINL